MKSQRLTRRIFAVLAALLALGVAGAVSAHPLGNFTINRYSALTFRTETVDVLYIVDMAEIPTFQERQAMDANHDGQIDPAEESAWAASLVDELAANLLVSVDGSPVVLLPDGYELTYPPGQGELPTTRLELTLTAALPAGGGDLLAFTYEDANFAGRLGWQEVIATAGDGRLLESTVPAAGVSDQLRAYPDDLLQAPLAVTRAEIRYAPAAAALAGDAFQSEPVEAAAAPANRFSQDEFANLLNRTLDRPGAWLLALLAAVGLGAAHALTPGHGKTIVGAYLVGSRGTARHALILGLTTTITHTAGVYALGLIMLIASEYILPEKLFPWLGALSGLLVALIGLSIFRGHLRQWLAGRHDQAHRSGHYHFHLGRGHTHAAVLAHATNPAEPATGAASGKTRMLAFAAVAPAGSSHTALVPAANHEPVTGPGHAHPHGHDHAHGHTHTLAPDGESPIALRNLLALGISGGLLPCPSALILMLSAIALHQVGVGLLLILAFSLGLAGVLTAIGLVMVYAGKALERMPVRHTRLTTRVLPMVSSLFVTLAGLLIALGALREAGII